MTYRYSGQIVLYDAKSEALGGTTLEVEVTNVSPRGPWVLVGQEEQFLSFDEFPWFKEASVSAVLKVERPGREHPHWPDLDVDLTLDSIRHPERYPLVSRVNATGIRGDQGPETDFVSTSSGRSQLGSTA